MHSKKSRPIEGYESSCKRVRTGVQSCELSEHSFASCLLHAAVEGTQRERSGLREVPQQRGIQVHASAREKIDDDLFSFMCLHMSLIAILDISCTFGADAEHMSTKAVDEPMK